LNNFRIIGVALVVLGMLGLIYGSFSYTKQTHEAKLGPIELSVSEQQTVNIPAWAGGAAIAAGLVLLVFGGRRS